MSDWAKDWEQKQKDKYKCPNCKVDSRYEMKRELVKDNEAYAYHVIEILVFFCKNCNNVYGIEV